MGQEWCGRTWSEKRLVRTWRPSDFRVVPQGMNCGQPLGSVGRGGVLTNHTLVEPACSHILVSVCIRDHPSSCTPGSRTALRNKHACTHACMHLNAHSFSNGRQHDTKNQLADILTKRNFTRDEWNHLLCLFDISHFSSTNCSEVMSKSAKRFR